MFGDTLKWATDLDASGFASGAQRVNSALGQMGMRTQAATMDLGALGTVLNVLANPMTGVALAGMAVGAALAGSVQAAAAWQSSMAGVSKTTGLAGPELAALSKELLDLSTNMPVAASELASIAQAGGSLGIAKEELAGFTEVAAQMGVGFEMAADKAATSGAKILNAFGQEMNTENLRSLGSVVNAMGDSFAATEPQVLDFLNRASFLNATMGQNIQQVAALGTTLISAGMDAEVAATGIKSALNMLTSETSKKGGMDNWAKLMGVSVDELKEKIETDLNSVLIETANQIAAIEDPVERFQAAVAAAGTEGAPAILKLAGQQENYAKALGMTNDEWEKANSLQKTFDAQASTANSQWQMFLNTLNMAAVELGTVMLPAISEALAFMSDLVKVSIRVGEELYNIGVKAWDALAPLREFWKYTPTGVASNLGGQVWGAIKDWAGIGEKHAEQMAKEISENENLQKAGEEAIRAGQDAGVFAAGEAGKAAGNEAGDAYAEAMTAALSRQSAGVSLAQAKMYEEGIAALKAAGFSGVLITGTGDAYEKQIVREFDYLGKRIKFIAKEEIGEYKMGDFYQYKFKVDGAIFDTGRLRNRHLTPVEAFELATGLPAPEEGTAAYYRLMGDEISAAKLELQNEISGVNLWEDFSSEASLLKFETDNKEAFDKVSDIVETHLYRAARDIEQNGPVVADLLGSSMGMAAGQVDPATLDESLQNVLNALADPGSVDTAILETSLAHLMGASLISASDSEEIKAAATVAAEGYMSALFGALSSAGEKRTLAEIIASGGEGVADVTAWMANEYQPGLMGEMESMNKLWDSGLTANRKIVEEDLKLLQDTFENHSNWFEDWQADLIAIYEEGDITTDQFLDMWDEYAKKADEKAATALDEIKSANAMFYGEFLSDNASWQSYVNEYGGYVGPTKLYGQYREAMDAEIAAAQAVNSKYGISTVGSIGMVAELDTTEALSATEELVARIQESRPDMVLNLDTNAAYTQWGHLVQDMENLTIRLPVELDIKVYTPEIRAIVDAAIVDALA